MTWQPLTGRCALCGVVKELRLKVLESHTLREPMETFLPQGVTEENQPHLFFSSLRWVCLARHILQFNCHSRCESQLGIQTGSFFFRIKKKNYRIFCQEMETEKIKRSQQSLCSSCRGETLPISKATLAWENSIFRGEEVWTRLLVFATRWQNLQHASQLQQMCVSDPSRSHEDHQIQTQIYHDWRPPCHLSMVAHSALTGLLSTKLLLLDKPGGLLPEFPPRRKMHLF